MSNKSVIPVNIPIMRETPEVIIAINTVVSIYNPVHLFPLFGNCVIIENNFNFSLCPDKKKYTE